MARLQDFPTVTPTSSDKLLVVQSQGQGLVPYGSKLDSANPTGTGYVSMNRTGSVGQNSVAVNTNCTASGAHSHAEGYQTTASGNYSHTEGSSTTASKSGAHAEGSGSTASGDYSHAEGNGTISNHRSQHVFGEYNTADASTAAATAKGNYIEIVGKGTADNARSNARTLDWNGNEVLAGDLTFKGNISLNALTTLLQGMTTFRIGGGASKTVTVIADGNSNFTFLVVGIGRSADLNPILMHIGGYVTASRSLITNITGKTGLTVDNSSTTNLNFVFTNTVSNIDLDIRLIPLFENSFTVT